MFGLFKSKSLMDWFEKESQLQYPQEVKKVLDNVIQTDTELVFEAYNFGTFVINDFSDLKKLKSKEYSNINETTSRNPFKVYRNVTGFIKGYLPQSIQDELGTIVPFATANWGDEGRFNIVISSKSNDFYLIDIDNPESTPINLGGNIYNFIPSEYVLKESDKSFFNLRKSYSDLIDSNSFLVIDAECVNEVMDYRKVLEQLISISNNELTLNSFNGQEIDGRRIIDVQINNISEQLNLQGATDWLDIAIIEQLNSILNQLNIENRYYNFYNEDFGQEAGICYCSNNKMTELKQQGIIR
jgi:hypothetical protein